MESEKNPLQGLKIPVIDFTAQPLKPETPEWDSLRSQVRRALEEFGCFEALFDGIPLDFRREFFKELEEVFDFPLETKLKNVSDIPFHGYIGQIPMFPLYESFGIGNVTNSKEVERFANILWSKGNPAFCETIQFFTQQLSQLDHIVKKMILESLGVEKHLEEFMKSNTFLMKFNKYKACQSTDTKTAGLRTHTDKSYLSILSQNQVDGLEVQTRDGEWISVQFSQPSSIVVAVGDSFHAWTNGHLYPVSHRVIMSSGNEARYSVGLFSSPKEGYMVKAPEELVDQQHPLLFNPYEYNEFLRFFGTEAGIKSGNNALKVYCGVKN